MAIPKLFKWLKKVCPRAIPLIRCDVAVPGFGGSCLFFLSEYNQEIHDFHYFMVDTGASSSIFDRDYVINVLKASPSFWSAGKLELAIGTNTVRPDLFEFTFFGKQGTFFCAPLDFLNDKFIDERVVAIIGNDLLRQWRAIINTHKQTLTIHE